MFNSLGNSFLLLKEYLRCASAYKSGKSAPFSEDLLIVDGDTYKASFAGFYGFKLRLLADYSAPLIFYVGAAKSESVDIAVSQNLRSSSMTFISLSKILYSWIYFITSLPPM